MVVLWVDFQCRGFKYPSPALKCPLVTFHTKRSGITRLPSNNLLIGLKLNMGVSEMAPVFLVVHYYQGPPWSTVVDYKGSSGTQFHSHLRCQCRILSDTDLVSSLLPPFSPCEEGNRLDG